MLLLLLFFVDFVVVQVLYTIYDPKSPADEKLLAADRKEKLFMDQYYNRTGIHWRHHYGMYVCMYVCTCVRASDTMILSWL